MMPMRTLSFATLLSIVAIPAWAADSPSIAGIPVEFFLFALTLLGVALLHNNTFHVALAGVTTVALYKMAFTGFKTGTGGRALSVTSGMSGSR